MMQPQEVPPCGDTQFWLAIIGAIGGVVASTLAAILAYMRVRADKRDAHRWAIRQLQESTRVEREEDLDRLRREREHYRQ